jgi:YHS domain-containing protein
MEAESLKSLGWLLLWGGLFFVMMRYGCGAHMMGGHGHGSHGGHSNAPPNGDTRDPVCGMTVDPQKTTAAAVREGVTFYFCSTSCRDKFELAPDKYNGTATHSAQQQGGHHHG